MKNRILFISALLIAMACQREAAGDETVIKTFSCFTVSVEKAEMTKAHMDEGGVVKWDVDDCIGVFSDKQAPVPYYRGEDGKFYGDEISGTQFYAFTPYHRFEFSEDHPLQLRARISDGTVGSGYFWAPMVAKGKDNTLSFKQTAGLLHFQIKSKGPVTIKLVGNDNEVIGGWGDIDLSSEKPELSLAEGNEDSWCWPGEAINPWSESAFDCYFPVPAMTFGSGITLEFFYRDENDQEKSIKRTTLKSVSISRAQMKSFALVDVDSDIEEELKALAAEREILFSFYQAMGGDGWYNKTNWCSDLPLDQWHGILLDDSGHVKDVSLPSNNLVGVIPASFSGLSHLEGLNLGDNYITGIESGFSPIPSLQSVYLSQMPSLKVFPTAIVQGGNLRWLYLEGSDCLSIPDEVFSNLSHLELLWIGKYTDESIPIPSKIGLLKELTSLNLRGYSSAIPEELYQLSNLTELNISSQKTTGGISESIGNFVKLKDLCLGSITNGESLDIPRNGLSGELPKALYTLPAIERLRIANTHLSGSLSPDIANLTTLRSLELYENDFSGALPIQLTSLPFSEGDDEDLLLYDNFFSGKVPSEYRSWSPWNNFWYYFLMGNDGLDLSEAMPKNPDFQVTLLDGTTYSSDKIAQNELTMLFQWRSSCPYTPEVLPVVKAAYNAFSGKGLDVLGWSDESRSTITDYLTMEGITWNNFQAEARTNTIHDPHFWMFGPYYPGNFTPAITLFDKQGNLVFSNALNDISGLKPFLEGWFGEPFDVDGIYASTDFSRDGVCTELQAATEGYGVNLVVMADGFSDRQIASGSYQIAVGKAVDALFGEEPYKSYKDRFNVYMVETVSPNDYYSGKTALGTYFGEGTFVGGDNEKVIAYAKNAVDESLLDDCTIIVLMNRDKYAGTCHYLSMPTGSDYGRGLAVAYIPLDSDAEEFAGTVRHEAGGHAFAKLADEYGYETYGAAPADYIAMQQERSALGWVANIDFTSDIHQIKWAQFASDTRFSSESIGAYEGGGTYYTGVWRPTVNSIMRYNDRGFNAPSRFAIWYRVNKLSNGASWEGTYEDFVTFDLNARTSPAATKSAHYKPRNYVERPLPPLPPPVVVNKDWREVRK